MKQYANVDEYINSCPKAIQPALEQLRQKIREAAPEALEKISYGLATYTLHGNLVHFGGYETHIALYPGPSGVQAFKASLKPYDVSKGTIRFPVDKPLPFDLIQDIVCYRVDENLLKKKK